MPGDPFHPGARSALKRRAECDMLIPLYKSKTGCGRSRYGLIFSRKESWKNMKDQKAMSSRIQNLTELIIEDYGKERVIDRLEMFTQPDRQVIEELIGKLLRLVYPGFFRDYSYRIINPRIHLAALIEDVAFHLKKQIGIALRSSSELGEEEAERQAEEITSAFLEKLPGIRAYVETDLQAFYDGDPAASSKEEVIKLTLASTPSR